MHSGRLTTVPFLIGSLTQDSIDFPQYDNYTENRFSAKLKYAFKKNLRFVLGYIYQELKYSDPQYDGYANVVGTPPNSYLTGAYQNQSYSANIVYLKAVYTFRETISPHPPDGESPGSPPSFALLKR